MTGSRRCTGVLAAFGLISVCAVFGLQPGRVVQAQEDPASRALLYLQTQQAADGSIAGPSGSYADSELYAIAAAADGFDPNALTGSSGVSVMSYLADNAASACTVSDPGACGELIQAVVAAGDHPASFGGQDLLTLVDASYDGSTGEYGDGWAFTEALAIEGLVADGAPVPSAAVSFLVNAQDSDGGWDYEAVRDDTSNVYDLSDTNSTSMVLMALDAAGDHADDASALAWLATQQDRDGGFPYQAGPGAVSDPDSTALVVQAIVATGGDPFATTWRVSGNTPLAYLEATQDPDGGYTFPGSTTGPDPFTTSQVPLALERLAFAVQFGSRQWYTPGTTLSSPPSASPSSTATPSPPSGPPAGVITAAPTPVPTAATSSPSPSSQVQAGAVTPTPAAASPPAPTAPSVQPAAASLAPRPGGGPPALLVYALVALAVAVVVGGGGLVLAARR